jgi:hypothetical protein
MEALGSMEVVGSMEALGSMDGGCTGKHGSVLCMRPSWPNLTHHMDDTTAWKHWEAWKHFVWTYSLTTHGRSVRWFNRGVVQLYPGTDVRMKCTQDPGQSVGGENNQVPDGHLQLKSGIVIHQNMRFQGPKQARAAGQPHWTTPRYGYSRLDSIPYQAI